MGLKCGVNRAPPLVCKQYEKAPTIRGRGGPTYQFRLGEERESVCDGTRRNQQGAVQGRRRQAEWRAGAAESGKDIKTSKGETERHTDIILSLLQEMRGARNPGYHAHRFWIKIGSFTSPLAYQLIDVIFMDSWLT